MKATINVILTAWVSGIPLLTLLPHILKLYSLLKLRPSLMRLINNSSKRTLHSRNKLNLLVWKMYKEGRLVIDEEKREKFRKELEKHGIKRKGKND